MRIFQKVACVVQKGQGPQIARSGKFLKENGVEKPELDAFVEARSVVEITGGGHSTSDTPQPEPQPGPQHNHSRNRRTQSVLMSQKDQ